MDTNVAFITAKAVLPVAVPLTGKVELPITGAPVQLEWGEASLSILRIESAKTEFALTLRTVLPEPLFGKHASTIQTHGIVIFTAGGRPAYADFGYLAYQAFNALLLRIALRAQIPQALREAARTDPFELFPELSVELEGRKYVIPPEKRHGVQVGLSFAPPPKLLTQEQAQRYLSVTPEISDYYHAAAEGAWLDNKLRSFITELVTMVEVSTYAARRRKGLSDGNFKPKSYLGEWKPSDVEEPFSQKFPHEYEAICELWETRNECVHNGRLLFRDVHHKTRPLRGEDQTRFRAAALVTVDWLNALK